MIQYRGSLEATSADPRRHGLQADGEPSFNRVANMNQYTVLHSDVALSLLAKDAPGSAVRVFLVLCMHANINNGACFPSINTIGELAHLKRRTVQDGIDWLESNNFIARDRRFDDSNGRQTSNTYNVLNWRGAGKCTGEGAADRTGEGAADRTPVKSTNKERELELNKPLYPLEKGKRPVLVLPSNLEPHREAIEEWLAYKREKGQTYKPRGLAGLLSDLSTMPNPTAAIRKSMACNYAGVFDKGSQPTQSERVERDVFGRPIKR